MALAEMLRRIQDIPDLGIVRRYPNTRKVAFYGYPVTLVYTVDYKNREEEAVIVVVAVFYSSDTLS
jgi:hypothetical protein